MTQLWRDTDPRFDINKRATIVVVSRRECHTEAFLAFVETKNDWSISTGLERYE